MEIFNEEDKYKIILENIPIILNNEIDKFNKCIEVIEEMKVDKALKFENLANKIENSLQQHQLIEYELESCKNSLDSMVDKINEKTISEITKIKNPNETIFEIVKLFLLITETIDPNENFNWTIFQTKQINFQKLKNNLNGIQIKNLNKDIIDQCMNITFNYNEIKIGMSKISKYLVVVLDVLKIIVDFMIKKNMKDSLQQTNINKTQKLNFLKTQIEDLKEKFNKAMDYLEKMRKEYEILIESDADLEFKDAILNKYDMAEKYKIFFEENNVSNINNNSESNNFNEFAECPNENIVKKKNNAEESYSSCGSHQGKKNKLTIKLKSKYQNENNFFFSILKANGETITNKDFTQNYSKSDINSTLSDKKYEIAKNLEKIQNGNFNGKSRNNKFDLLGNSNNYNYLENNKSSRNKLNNLNTLNKKSPGGKGDFSQNEISDLNTNKIKFKSINVNINDNQLNNFNNQSSINFNEFNNNPQIEKNVHLNLNLNLNSFINPHPIQNNGNLNSSKNISVHASTIINTNNNPNLIYNNSNNNNNFNTSRNNVPIGMNKNTNNNPIHGTFTFNSNNLNNTNNSQNKYIQNLVNGSKINNNLKNFNMSNSKVSNHFNKDISNLTNKNSNEIQIRSNLQIKDLSKSNSIYQGNSTLDKIKNYQKIQKIKINYDNIKLKENIIPKNNTDSNIIIDNTSQNKNKNYFKSTIDEVFSSENKEVKTKDPSFRSNSDKNKEEINKSKQIIETKEIILEPKFNTFDDKIEKLKKQENILNNVNYENSPISLVNDIESKNVNEKNLENTGVMTKNIHSNKNLKSNKNVILEKSKNSKNNDCIKQLCCMK